MKSVPNFIFHVFCERLICCWLILFILVANIISGFVYLRAIDVRKLDLQFASNAAIDEDSDPYIHYHVSDTHINVAQIPETVHKLAHFMRLVKRVEPAFVLHYGDITDGRGEGAMNSGQMIADWQMYAQLLIDHGFNNTDVWIDSRGNHDTFRVDIRDDSFDNLYENYGNTNQQYRSAQIIHHTRRIKEFVANDHHFLFFDACPDTPGLPTPINLSAYMRTGRGTEVDKLMRRMKELGEMARGTNRKLFYLTHYPANSMHDRAGLRILDEIDHVAQNTGFTARLSGHLHREKMYWNADGTLIDIELADMVHKNYYRVCVTDRGLFSFADAKLTDKRVVVVTSPKDARFLSLTDQLNAMRTRKEIRFVVIDDATIGDNKTGHAHAPWPDDETSDDITDREDVDSDDLTEVSEMLPEAAAQSGGDVIDLGGDEDVPNERPREWQDVHTIDVYVDDEHIGRARRRGRYLHAIDYDPAKYDKGVHQLRLLFEDGRTVTQDLSLDGTKVYMGDNWVRVFGTVSMSVYTHAVIIVSLLVLLLTLWLPYWFFEGSEKRFVEILRGEDNYESVGLFYIFEKVCYLYARMDMSSRLFATLMLIAFCAAPVWVASIGVFWFR